MEGNNTPITTTTTTTTTSLGGTAVTVVTADAPSDFHVAPRTTADANPAPVSSTVGSSQPMSVTETLAQLTPSQPNTVRKKRGRPRKYGPDGSVVSPKPISSSAPPPVIDFSSSAAAAGGKRGKVRSVGSVSKVHHHHHQQQQQQQMFRVDGVDGFGNAGEWVSCSVGANFTPHIITVNAGEDVTMKVISFSQQGPRAICILSANGVISSVTLRQPDSSGGTLTYEGLFEILSLTGSFMPSETGGIRNRSGGMSVSLASPDGRVMGGGVAGLLVAAGPVQIVVGSFLAGNQLEQKIKKPKADTVTVIPTPAIPIASAGLIDDATYHRSSSFRGDSWSSGGGNKPTDITTTLPA